MKVLLLVLACLASFAHAGVKPDALAKSLKIIDACIEEHDVNKGKMYMLFFQKKPIEDQAMKCTMDCALEQAKILKDGKIDWEAAKEKAEEMLDDETLIKKALETAETCKSRVNLDEKQECEIGASLLPCLMEGIKQGFATL